MLVVDGRGSSDPATAHARHRTRGDARLVADEAWMIDVILGVLFLVVLVVILFAFFSPVKQDILQTQNATNTDAGQPVSTPFGNFVPIPPDHAWKLQKAPVLVDMDTGFVLCLLKRGSRAQRTIRRLMPGMTGHRVWMQIASLSAGNGLQVTVDAPQTYRIPSDVIDRLAWQSIEVPFVTGDKEREKKIVLENQGDEAIFIQRLRVRMPYE